MKNFYFYQTDLSTNKPNFLVCFYSGATFCLEAFCNEVVTQFKSSIFIRNIVFITPEFNKDEITQKLLNPEAQIKIKDRVNSFQEINFHTCFVKRNGQFELTVFNEGKSKLKSVEMNNLIDFGLYNIIINRNLIVEAHSNIHFIKPSGKHTSKFIDVKNLLESSAEISFIATSLLKLLPEKLSKIYVDTSGVYSLAFELSNITRAFDKSAEIISIDSFGSYGGLEQYNFSSDANTLVLISASTSNNLFKKLRINSSLEKASLVSVIMTQVNDSEQKVLVEFEKYKNKFCKSYFEHFHSYDENECPMCLKEHSIPIALDKSRFIFDSPRTEAYLPLAVDSDNNLRCLINKYKDLDAFRCLFDGVDGTKKPTPEYFIDVSKIIQQQSFKERVQNNIHRFFPLNTDCIIHCKDQGAKELANLIQKNISQLDLEVDLYDGEIPHEITPKKGIVVVAGSLESGKSLLNISRALRKFNELPITYIVGFAKYNSESEFKKLQMDLKFSEGPCGFHQFHVIEKILMPINEHKENSWDKELELLKKLGENHQNDAALKAVIEQRDKKLRSASSIKNQGLGKHLFLASPVGKDLVLGKTFAFWNKGDNDHDFYHQSTVYFTVSSVLQRLRTTAKNNGTIPLGTGYIIRQLDPLLFDRFNEGVIQASVLRTAKSRELDYSADDAKSRIIGSLIERMLKFPETEESTGLPEILLALCTKKLQVKKDHLLGFSNHSIDKVKHSMTWMLVEYAKQEILENTTANELSVTVPL
ncbi:hypothetical protein JK628_15465 [Shewanella sp. KX20019]|uniref:hypothetical protein n=1 Tax=Shewanella sp. KX20019 TaxID=2803864 RepID=UPI001927E464|nr:hypothetical protein [Shewanella sp. KX20019]QQX78952.1 hypothetical protein JK628_15465 [Shewanella sp. KX20019]